MPKAKKVQKARRYASDIAQDTDRVVTRRHHRLESNVVEVPGYVESPDRIAATASFKRFIQTYIAHRFISPFSADHLKALERMEIAIRTGGQFAQSAPRGDGKTERTIAAVLWALLCGHRRYIVVVGADLQAAKGILAEIEQELADNDLFARDWPEVCLPIRLAFDRPNRSKYLMFDAGLPCRLECKTSKLVLPCHPSAPQGIGGSVVEARGLTAGLRGMRHTTADGLTLRPDLAIIDDPQTDESADSVDQCDTREGLITSAVLGMAGPRSKIAAICNATVIRRNDLADRLLDQKKHPEWRGVRFKFLYEWPKRRDLWDLYMEMRREGHRNGDNGAKAAEFYLANRAEMDAGARVSWEHRYRDGEHSAIQCAFNIIADRGEASFMSEYQNEPVEDRNGIWRLTSEKVMANTNGLARGVVPADANTLTLGVDVNITHGINWVVTAWTSEAVGAVIDYGRFPNGDSPLWSEKSGHTEEQAIFGGITAVLDDVLFNRQYTREGTKERVWMSAAGVDCGYKLETVFSAVKAARGKYGAVQLFPIRGVGGKGYWPRQAVRKGDGWHVAPYGTSLTKTLFHNSDLWRERTQRAYLLPPGCPGGSLGLWGSKPAAHEAYAREICSERIVDILHSDRLALVYVWFHEPGIPNDKLDATTYATVAAGFAGIRFQQQAVSGGNGAVPGMLKSDTVATVTAPIPAPPPAPSPPPYRPRHLIPRRQGGFAKNW